MKKILNACPYCGNKLEVVNLYQKSMLETIGKRGKRLAHVRWRDEGSIYCYFISCTECYFHTNTDLEDLEVENDRSIKISEDNDGTFYIEIDE